MRNPLLFFRDLMRQPPWVVVWVAILGMANMASLLFWSVPLAKLIFVTFMVSVVAMMALYSYFGFERILGAGHVLWLVLVPYLLLQLPHVEGGFCGYLVVLSVFLSVSLVFDTADVWKHFKRRRG